MEPPDLPEATSRWQSLIEGGGSSIALLAVVALAVLFFGYLLIDGYWQKRKWKRLLRTTRREDTR